MDAGTTRRFLGWCTLINFVLLLWWWGWLAAAGDFVYQMHGDLLRIQISRPVFDAIHYGGMLLFKLLVFVFSVVPYLVLRFAFKAGELARPARARGS